MSADTRFHRPNVAALEGPVGRSIFETIRDAPQPDWERISEQSRALEQRIVEALKHAAS